ncbi:DUF7033 domain-containing protein [Gracilimonas sp. BCB1]|uniref:DUF7033 domain-containing protein n=1 Tax=Gracilimonas sp. BCB1 TaxID=3152362 RepID=UPI0032D907E3
MKQPDVIKEYILDVFFSIYKCKDCPKISYGNDDGDIIILTGKINFFDGKDPIPQKFTWKLWRDKELPFLFDNEDSSELIENKNGRIYINYDIIASSFFFLSSWQEIHQSEKDLHGRFEYRNSIQYQHDFPLIPVVNYYFDILKTAIRQAEKNISNRLKEKSNLSVFLSHDIDSINRGWVKDAFSEIKEGRFLSASRIMVQRLRAKDDWNNIEEIVALEKELGVSSTFFFLTEYGNNNADYKLKDVQTAFNTIRNAGSEIGIHGSLGSGLIEGQLENELQKFDIDITGNRFHFLKIDSSVTPAIIEKAGLSYSCSNGFAEQIGFRNGFCFPFRPFNFKTGRAYQHYQIPLTLMDTTLRDKNYMGRIPGNELERQINILIDETERFGGVLSILWHNSYFTDYKFKGWREKYIHLIELLKKRTADFRTGRKTIQLLKNAD